MKMSGWLSGVCLGRNFPGRRKLPGGKFMGENAKVISRVFLGGCTFFSMVKMY